MNILYLTYPLNGLLMIFLPIILAIYLSKVFGAKWRLWWIGCATFLLSQVGHIPFNLALTRLFTYWRFVPESMVLVFNSIVLGLSAGLWEELARYAAFRWWAKDARSWPRGLMLGAGHGGVEAIILGVIVLVGFVNVLVVSNMDLNTMLPPEAVLEAEGQIQAYLSAPWPATLLGALERLFAITLHLSLSLMVMQAFVRRQAFWLWLAVLWHALVDGVAVYTASVWGIYQSEAMIAGFALISLAIILILRPSEQPDLIYHEGPAGAVPGKSLLETPQAETTGSELPEIEETPENLDKTRYA